MKNPMLSKFMEKHWKRGLAVGSPDIRSDSVDFVYKDEKFNFPALQVLEFCKQNGSFFTAKVTKLRELRNRHG